MNVNERFSQSIRVLNSETAMISPDDTSSTPCLLLCFNRNEYLIFQKILKLEYAFPEKFFPKAKDLVERLLVIFLVFILDHQKRRKRSSLLNHIVLSVVQSVRTTQSDWDVRKWVGSIL